VILWITDGLGTASSLGLVTSSEFSSLDVRDLVDKSGNAVDLVRAKIEEGSAILASGQRLVVFCDYGISRSNAIAAGILAKNTGNSFDAALQQVVKRTGEKAIKLDLINIVRTALGEKSEGLGAMASRPATLVTGGGGFLGTALVKKLASFGDVVAPSRAELNLIDGAIDLEMLCRNRGVAQIVHLAQPRVYNDNAALGATLVMLRNVLDVCRQHRLRLITLSGWEIYSGYRSRYLVADESLPPMPRGPYGESKYLFECLIEQHQRQYDLDVAMLRASPIYGPGGDRPKFLFTFHERARAGLDIFTHHYINGPPVLDLLHLDDALAALLMVITQEVTGIFNIGSGIGHSTPDIAAMINEWAGGRSSLRERKVSDYTANVIMDWHRAQVVLGWQPKVAVVDGLRHTLGFS
jgi:nucleoside-diphosphate-sugar epimerase